MNQSLPALFAILRRTLREAVAPELTSDHASSQLAGALDILGKLEGMVAWSPEATRAQEEFLAGCARDFQRLAAAAGVNAPAPPADPVAGEAHLRALIDWLFDHEPTLPPATFAELDSLVQGTLRRLLIVERKLVPRADFGSMTAGASKTRPPPGET